jgi:hypothetical protein
MILASQDWERFSFLAHTVIRGACTEMSQIFVGEPHGYHAVLRHGMISAVCHVISGVLLAS